MFPSRKIAVVVCLICRGERGARQATKSFAMRLGLVGRSLKSVCIPCALGWHLPLTSVFFRGMRDSKIDHEKHCHPCDLAWIEGEKIAGTL